MLRCPGYYEAPLLRLGSAVLMELSEEWEMGNKIFEYGRGER